MADIRNVGPKIAISTGTTGNRLWFGNASDNEGGAISFHFSNAGDSGGAGFNGSLTIVARMDGIAPSLDGVQPVPIPFRALYLNGAPSDASLQMGGTPVTDTSLILVPAMGTQIAVDVVCASGGGTLYSAAFTGTTVL